MYLMTHPGKMHQSRDMQKTAFSLFMCVA